MSSRFMRILILFDLPVVTKEARREYTNFRKFLIKDGFDMMQYSVYSRLCRGIDSVNKHMRRVKSHLPPKGAVRAMVVTEKQFAAMQILVGKKRKIHKDIDPVQLSLF